MTPENLRVIKSAGVDRKVAPALSWGQQGTVSHLMNLARLDELRALADRLIAESPEPALHRLAKTILEAIAEAAKAPVDSDEDAAK